MHINVRDILAEEVGYNRSFTITGERPALESVVLTADINGEVRISRLEDGLLIQGQIITEVELECHRCLRSFTRPVSVAFTQVFAPAPTDDEMPIDGDLLDLAPLIEQEILVNLPIKILCTPDCPGVEGAAEQYTKEDTPGPRVKDQARITKGSPNARFRRT